MMVILVKRGIHKLNKSEMGNPIKEERGAIVPPVNGIIFQIVNINVQTISQL